MDLSKFAQVIGSSKSTKPAVGDVTTFVAFAQHLKTEGLRMSYTAAHIIGAALGLVGLHEIGKPSAHRVLYALPAELQYVVCRSDGTYKDTAIAKWAQLAPTGYAQQPVIGAENAEGALAAFKAST